MDEENDGAFTFGELRRSATESAAQAEPCSEKSVLPLRSYGWIQHFKDVARDREEFEDQENARKGLPSLPHETYCYMCASYDVKNVNPFRSAIERLIALQTEMDLKRVCNLVAQYHLTCVLPRTKVEWTLDSIYDHITVHTVNPVYILTKNVRGIQVHIDAHVAVMEEEEIIEEGMEGDGEDVDDDIIQQRVGPRRKKIRKINPKEEEQYIKLVRLQTSVLTTLEKMKADRNR